MRTRSLLPAAAAFSAAVLGFGLTVRAEEPPAHPPQKPIDHPLLTAAVGDWTVSFTGHGPTGTMTGKATSKIAKGLGGTALFEDYSAPEMMPGGYQGHAVIKTSADGTTMTLWWFDSMGPEPIKLSGPLTADSATIEGPSPMGPMKIVWKKAEGGFDFEGTMSGKPWLSQKYRK